MVFQSWQAKLVYEISIAALQYCIYKLQHKLFWLDDDVGQHSVTTSAEEKDFHFSNFINTYVEYS